VLRKAKNAKQEDAYKSYVEALKKDAKVNIDDAKLGAIEIKSQRRPFAPGMGEGAEEGGEENAGELVGAPAAGADGAAAAEGGATGPRPVLPGAGGPGAGGPGGPGGKRPMPGRPMPNTAPGH
jgi:hypothetical protein